MDVSSLNLYAYCANDPVNYVDPSGHEREVVSIEKTSRTSSSGKVFVTTTTTMSNGTKYKVTRSAENDSLSRYIIRGGGQIVSVGDYVNSGGTSEKGEWNLESVTAYGQAMAEANEKGEFVTYDRWADQFHKKFGY